MVQVSRPEPLPRASAAKRGTRRQLLLGAACAVLAPGAAGAGGLSSIAVSSPGSVFHSAGSALASVANEEGGLPMTVQAFASPNVYLPAVDAGQIAFGISNVGDARLAHVGEMHFTGRALARLRAAAVMFPLRMAVYVPKDSPIRTVADLRGRRLPTGFAGQKTLVPLVESLLATAGLTSEDVEQVRVPNVVSGANAFMERKADAFFFALGAAKVREADAAVGGLRVLPVEDTPEALAAVHRHWPAGYLLAVAPGPANTGVLEPTFALTHDAIVAAGTLTPDEAVYALVRTMHDNRDALRAAFGSFSLFDPNRMMVDIPGVDWHPGALAYYRDAGLIAVGG